MLKKKMKGVLIGSSPSYVFDDETKSRKFQTLMQDYNDLVKETEVKRRNIQLAKRRRHILLAEVRFLRQRYEELMEYQSREQDLARTQISQTHRDAHPAERSGRDKEAALPNPVPVLDLNQVANDEDEEMEFQHVMEPLKEKSPMKLSLSRSGKPPLPPRPKDLKLWSSTQLFYMWSLQNKKSLHYGPAHSCFINSRKAIWSLPMALPEVEVL